MSSPGPPQAGSEATEQKSPSAVKRDIRARVTDWLFDDAPSWFWFPASRFPIRWAFPPTVPVLFVLCLVKGHEPTCQGCDRPEDDECSWCSKVLPGRAHPGGAPCPR